MHVCLGSAGASMPHGADTNVSGLDLLRMSGLFVRRTTEVSSMCVVCKSVQASRARASCMVECDLSLQDYQVCIVARVWLS